MNYFNYWPSDYTIYRFILSDFSLPSFYNFIHGVDFDILAYA